MEFQEKQVHKTALEKTCKPLTTQQLNTLNLSSATQRTLFKVSRWLS